MSDYSLVEEGLYAGRGCVRAPPVDAVICLDPTCRVEAPGAEEYCYPVDEFSVEPFGHTAGAIARLVELRSAGARVYVHCAAGCGRTGAVVSSYLVLARGLSGDEAIAYYRRVRGCGPESWDQVELVYALERLRSRVGPGEALRILLESRGFEDFLGRVRAVTG